MTTKNNWQDDFDKKFTFYDTYDPGVLDVDGEDIGGVEASKAIKQFITNLLQEIEDEVEGVDQCFVWGKGDSDNPFDKSAKYINKDQALSIIQRYKEK